jgi:ketosteroid isomerase-like protein
MEPQRLAAALRSLLENGDGTQMEALLAPGAVTWHNTDHVALDARENHDRVSKLLSAVSDPRVDVVRAAPLVDGVVVQFIYRGTYSPTNRSFEMHNCIVARCDANGQIERIDEYVDGNARGAFAAPDS